MARARCAAVPIVSDGTTRPAADRSTATSAGAGSGVDLVMKFKGMSFIEAKRLIEEHLPSAVLEVPKAKTRTANIDKLESVWRAALPLKGDDPASWYLARRGLSFEGVASLRWIAKFPYFHDDKSKTEHPVMLSL